jgi:hypothetical protein
MICRISRFPANPENCYHPRQFRVHSGNPDWDEIREKLFKNYALKSIDAVRRKLEQAILYIERNPETVKSITSFPYIVRSL